MFVGTDLILIFCRAHTMHGAYVTQACREKKWAKKIKLISCSIGRSIMKMLITIHYVCV
jgi:hypothetical protein